MECKKLCLWVNLVSEFCAVNGEGAIERHFLG